jgi:lipopolysaccharide export system permease protein
MARAAPADEYRVILFRYVVREILLTAIAVTFTLLVIVISSRQVAYLGSAATGDLPARLVFSIIFFRLPGFLELILPLAFFVSVLLALGRLYVDSEMVVIAACGVGPRRLLGIVLAPALLVALLVALLSLVVSPYATERVQKLLHQADATTGLELLSAGRFHVINQGRGRVTYVDRMDNETGEMFGVFAADRYTQSDGSSRQVLVVAERGHSETNAETGDRFLVLQNGTRYLGQPGGLEFQVMDFATLGQRLEQPHAGPIYRKQDTLSTSELLRSRRPDSQATLQWRYSLALLVLVSTLMAVAMARTDNRRGRYGKLFPAFLLFMVYLVLLNAAREAVGKQRLSVDIGLWWVHGLFLIVGLLQVFGGDRWRAWRARRSPGAAPCV